MSKISNLTLEGEENEYDFNVYKYGTQFKSIGAVYAMTKRYQDSDGNHLHSVKYVGETEDLSTRFDDHHKEDCFEKNDVNCMCIHSEGKEKLRLKKEKDLLANRNTSCNE